MAHMRALALIFCLGTLAVASCFASSACAHAQAPPPAGAPAPAPVLTAAQQGYLALARSGVAHAQRRWRDPRRGWYDARLDDHERYPLATIWDIVPLFESLDAITIAQPTSTNRHAVARFAAGAERYLNRGLRPIPGYSPYPGDREPNTETWFDDNGWWGLAFLQAYRATGTRRYLTDAERALRYIAAAGWEPNGGGNLVEHAPPLQVWSGACRRHPAGHAHLPAGSVRVCAGAGSEVHRLGEHRRLQRRRRAVHRQQRQRHPRRLHRVPADLRPGGALPDHERTGRL